MAELNDVHHHVRTLLEGERVGLQDAHRRGTQHQRERVIDIKMPARPYTPRASSLTTRQHMDFRYTQPTSTLRRSPVPPSGSMSPSRVIPITVTERERNQSPASRRDMISFTKARAATSAPFTTTTTTAKDKQTGQSENKMCQKTTAEERTVKIKQITESSNTTTTTETTSMRVVSPAMMSLNMKTETESRKQVSDEREKDHVYGDKFTKKWQKESLIGPNEKKILDTVAVEEIIEKAINPAGWEDEGESKVRYHVEKRQQEDGTIKTQIVLESRVEEEMDISEDIALDKLLSQGVQKVSLEDIKDTATGNMIKNLLSGLQGGEDMQNKSVSVEIIEEPAESHSDEEHEAEQKSSSTLHEPSSTYFQIEELENVPQDVQFQRSDSAAMKTSMTDTDHCKGGSNQVQEVSRESDSSLSHDQEPHEYFVSTPDDNVSETEEGGGITSYGHYGLVDDLSDERYYQDEDLPPRRVIVEESNEYKYMSGDHSFVKGSSQFPECIIEEEVRVSPEVQESVLEFLREDSLEPKDQLKGALEKLQGSVSGPLREELAFLTQVSSPQNVAVKKVQHSSDNGTMTIVAELNVSQSLEDSGLLEEDDLSEEQIMAHLRSSNLGFEKVFQGGAGGGYSFKVSKEEDIAYGEEFEGFTNQGESASEFTEKHIKLGPSETSFTFQMGMQGSLAEATSEQDLQPQILETPVKISHEKRIATVFLESPTDD